MTLRFSTIALSLPAIALLASCGASAGTAAGGQVDGDGADADGERPFAMAEMGAFDEPWAIEVEPGTGTLFVTEKAGTMKFLRPDGTVGTVSGVPDVAYAGQGGLGDFAFAPDYAQSRMVYLSWAEAGEGETRGAAVGRAMLDCQAQTACSLNDLTVIWRQTPKVTGGGHYSHRIVFSPDGQYLFIASGDRQKQEPAQDLSNTLGTIVRLLPDGTPAPGNPFADRGGVSAQIWTYGNRNILGMDFAPDGRLWEVEHGPRGGDELNLVQPGNNYGWPEVSNGKHYRGEAIPDHDTTDRFTRPAVSWTPVIAPGDMIIYSGDLFPEWRGQPIITGLKSEALIRVAVDGDNAREVARYEMPDRIRSIAQAEDGAIWIAEDGGDGKIYRLTPAS